MSNITDQKLTMLLETFYAQAQKKAADLEFAQNQLSNIRATLLVNFNEGSILGNLLGVVIIDTDKIGTHDLMLMVLEKLRDKCMTVMRSSLPDAVSGESDGA